MKTTFYAAIAFVMMLMTGSMYGQTAGPGDDPGGPPRGPERLEQFRRMRLIEVLKLNEEDAVRFFAKQSIHEDNVRELMKQRNETLGDMKKSMKEKGKAEELQKGIDKVLDIDQKIFAERRRYQDDVRKLLTPEQFAKFLVFEQNFGRQMRDALDEMVRPNRRERDDRPEREE